MTASLIGLSKYHTGSLQVEFENKSMPIWLRSHFDFYAGVKLPQLFLALVEWDPFFSLIVK
jgi:hypothetical protein